MNENELPLPSREGEGWAWRPARGIEQTGETLYSTDSSSPGILNRPMRVPHDHFGE